MTGLLWPRRRGHKRPSTLENGLYVLYGKSGNGRRPAPPRWRINFDTRFTAAVDQRTTPSICRYRQPRHEPTTSGWHPDRRLQVECDTASVKYRPRGRRPPSRNTEPVPSTGYGCAAKRLALIFRGTLGGAVLKSAALTDLDAYVSLTTRASRHALKDAQDDR